MLIEGGFFQRRRCWSAARHQLLVPPLEEALSLSSKTSDNEVTNKSGNPIFMKMTALLFLKA